MARYGLLVPVDARAREDGRYDLVEGRCRLEIARDLGWRAIDAIIEPADAAALPAELKAILVNLHRRDLQHLHLARQCGVLMRREGWTQAELARQIDRSASSICKGQKVLACPDLVRAIENEELEFGAAKVLAPLPPADRRAVLAELRREAIRRGRSASVREVEALARKQRGEAPLPEVSREQAAAVVTELCARGATIDVQVLAGRGAARRVALKVTQEDELWLRGLLGQAAAEGAASEERDARLPDSAAPPADDLRAAA